MADRRNVVIVMPSYRDYDPTDPYQRQALMDQIARDQAETRRDIAQRQERLAAGLDREWHVPQPEPAPAAVRPSHGPQTHTREWVGWVSHEIESRVAARLHALREECASVIAEIASEYDQKLLEVERRLRDEHDAKLQGFMAGLRMGQAEPDVVIDAKHLRTGRLDA